MKELPYLLAMCLKKQDLNELGGRGRGLLDVHYFMAMVCLMTGY